MSDPRLHADLRGRTVMVTGASAGIGVAIAETFGACDAEVILLGRDTERLDAVSARIEANGGSASPLAVDLTTDDGPERAVGHALARFGKIDILVHNAGTFDFSPSRRLHWTAWTRSGAAMSGHRSRSCRPLCHTWPPGPRSCSSGRTSRPSAGRTRPRTPRQKAVSRQWPERCRSNSHRAESV